MILAIKFLKDCLDYDYAISCDREICDLSLDSHVESLALVCEDSKKIYDYGSSVSLSDNFNHKVFVSNDSMNCFRVFFGKLFLCEYHDINCLSSFFNSFFQELYKK